MSTPIVAISAYYFTLRGARGYTQKDVSQRSGIPVVRQNESADARPLSPLQGARAYALVLAEHTGVALHNLVDTVANAYRQFLDREQQETADTLAAQRARSMTHVRGVIEDVLDSATMPTGQHEIALRRGEFRAQGLHESRSADLPVVAHLVSTGSLMFLIQQNNTVQQTLFEVRDLLRAPRG